MPGFFCGGLSRRVGLMLWCFVAYVSPGWLTGKGLEKVGRAPIFVFWGLLLAMGEIEERLTKVIEPSVRSLGYELLGIELLRGGEDALLRLYIDAEGGIGVEDCVRVSRQVSGLLDVEDPVSGAYQLEVSSPGSDRPLFSAAHFERFVGSNIRIKMRLPLEGRKRFTGFIEAFSDGCVTLAERDQTWRIPLKSIASTRLVPEY